MELVLASIIMRIIFLRDKKTEKIALIGMVVNLL